MKNLYLLKRNDKEKGDAMYDQYDSMVVCASSIEEAKRITIQRHSRNESWVDSADKIDGRLIGTAHKLTRVGVVLESFNAG